MNDNTKTLLIALALTAGIVGIALAIPGVHAEDAEYRVISGEEVTWEGTGSYASLTSAVGSTVYQDSYGVIHYEAATTESVITDTVSGVLGADTVTFSVTVVPVLVWKDTDAVGQCYWPEHQLSYEVCYEGEEEAFETGLATKYTSQSDCVVTNTYDIVNGSRLTVANDTSTWTYTAPPMTEIVAGFDIDGEFYQFETGDSFALHGDATISIGLLTPTYMLLVSNYTSKATTITVCVNGETIQELTIGSMANEQLAIPVTFGDTVSYLDAEGEIISQQLMDYDAFAESVVIGEMYVISG